MSEMPSLLSLRIIWNSLSTSCAMSEEVGSSSTMTLALYEMALAISHIWRCETLMFFIGCVRFTVMPRRRNRSAASLRMRPSSTTPRLLVG